MNFSLFTEYPWWFVLFCFTAGFLYSSVLYYKNGQSGIDRRLGLILGVLRFISVTIISFLLLSPFFKTVLRKVEKPVIVIAQDNSESILFNKDSTFYQNEYKEKLNKLVNDLSEKNEVRTYSFGEKISEGFKFDYKEKETDISLLFEEINNRFSNRNLGAIILASDGLYNKGLNPAYSGNKATVYTIALGDTSIKKDVILSKVEHNQVAYLGNSFPVEITAEAKQLKGKSIRLSITKGKNVLFNKVINFNSDNYSEKINVLLDAKEAGMQRYRVTLYPLAEESTGSNNSRDIFVEVLDGRQKVLLLANAPHPDIAAIKQSLEASRNYEVENFLTEEFNGPINKYDLVILHGLPSQKSSSAKIMNSINSSTVSAWFIISVGTGLGQFNALQAGLNITGGAGKLNEAEAVLSSEFPLFTVSDPLQASLKDMPALQCPFGSYKINNATDVLLYQQIGVVKTENPLMMFTHQGEKKISITAGEGLWKWRLRDYALHSNHDNFNELVSKTVQYLSVKTDKSQFRVSGKKIFMENEPVELDAEVYNESFELIHEPDVTINIVNSENKKFPFSFSKTSRAYHLNAGAMPVGEYRYEALVKIGDKLLSKKGEFSISPLVIESVNTVADHHLLKSLAKKNQGEMVFPAEMEKLADLINKKEDIRSVSFTEKSLTDLVNLKWLFFMILVLLSLEWIMRKRNGTY